MRRLAFIGGDVRRASALLSRSAGRQAGPHPCAYAWEASCTHCSRCFHTALWAAHTAPHSCTAASTGPASWQSRHWHWYLPSFCDPWAPLAWLEPTAAHEHLHVLSNFLCSIHFRCFHPPFPAFIHPPSGTHGPLRLLHALVTSHPSTSPGPHCAHQPCQCIIHPIMPPSAYRYWHRILLRLQCTPLHSTPLPFHSLLS